MAIVLAPFALLAWWSFLVATAHGAGFMLLPIALVFRWLGLGFLRRACFDLDLVWGVSLFLTGAVSVVLAAGR